MAASPSLAEQLKKQRGELQSFDPSTSIYGYENILRNHIHSAQLDHVDIDKWKEETRKYYDAQNMENPWYRFIKSVEGSRSTLRKVYPGERACERKGLFVDIGNHLVVLKEVEEGGLTQEWRVTSLVEDRRKMLEAIRIRVNKDVIGADGYACIVM